jgi:integrase
MAPKHGAHRYSIRNAKPKERPYKLGDSLGLFLLVQPSGGKLWRLKYRLAGKEKKLALGTYPAIGLPDARAARDVARSLLASGGDPSLEKQRSKQRAHMNASNLFDDIAREYVAKRVAEGWANRTAEKALYHLSLLSAGIGRFPVTEIQPADVLAVLKRVEAKGNLETVRRMLQFAGAVLRYAVATARLASDPTRDLRCALIAPKVKHHGALLKPIEVGGLLRAIEGYDGHYITRSALQISPHVFVRPGELRQATWQEVDLEAAVWTIPAAKMKMRREHHVPLSRQSVAMLQSLKLAQGGRTELIFPSIRSTARPMSENTVNAALRRLGYTSDQMTAHGFRSTASTLLNESGKWSADAIERALAHGDANQIRGSNNRGEFWDERLRMAQWWSDHLDMLRSGADVLPFQPKAGRGA